MGKEEKEQKGKKIVLINTDDYLSRAVLPLPPPQPQVQPEQSPTCLRLIRALEVTLLGSRKKYVLCSSLSIVVSLGIWGQTKEKDEHQVIAEHMRFI